MQEHQENPQDGIPPEFMRMDASLNKDIFDPKIKDASHQKNQALPLQGAVRTTELH